MEFHLIWGQDKNGGIGNNNSLPWHISSDLKNFKKLTLNSPIIMGRRTWESLKTKPLPKRRNIVLSTNQLKNVEYYNTINTCIQKLKKDNLNKVFIIGGAQVYKKFFPYADYLHITLIEKTINEIDTWFPISLQTIKIQFDKKEESNLNEIAIYTKWTRKK